MAYACAQQDLYHLCQLILQTCVVKTGKMTSWQLFKMNVYILLQLFKMHVHILTA